MANENRDDRSNVRATAWRLLPFLALSFLFLPPFTSSSSGRTASSGDPHGPIAPPNPVEQRAEMIALLRSIDSRLESIEKVLANKAK